MVNRDIFFHYIFFLTIKGPRYSRDDHPFSSFLCREVGMFLIFSSNPLKLVYVYACTILQMGFGQAAKITIRFISYSLVSECVSWYLTESRCLLLLFFLKPKI